MANDTGSETIANDVQWRLTSKQGNKFVAGYTVEDNGSDAESADSQDIVTADASGPDFSINVDWGITNGWVQTSPEVANTTGITSYNLTDDGSILYTYRLYFICRDTYDYFFTDGSRDTYEVDTWTTGKHYFDYNSKDPRITHISGS